MMADTDIICLTCLHASGAHTTATELQDNGEYREISTCHATVHRVSYSYPCQCKCET